MQLLTLARCTKIFFMVKVIMWICRCTCCAYVCLVTNPKRQTRGDRNNSDNRFVRQILCLRHAAGNGVIKLVADRMNRSRFVKYQAVLVPPPQGAILKLAKFAAMRNVGNEFVLREFFPVLNKSYDSTLKYKHQILTGPVQITVTSCRNHGHLPHIGRCST